MQKPGKIENAQIDKISSRNLERITRSSDKFDSTIDERERTYQTRKPEPRLTEYR